MNIIVNIKEPLTSEVVESIVNDASKLESITVSYMGINGNFEMLSLIQTMQVTGEFEIDINGNQDEVEKALELLRKFELLK